MIRRWIATALVVLAFVVLCGHALASGTFYLHDHESYWWYMRTDPRFSIVVPNDAERYVEKRVSGQRIMEMTWNDGTALIQVVSLPGESRDTVLDSVQGQYLPLLSDVTIVSDREITTSNGLTAYFYAVEGTDARGTRSMVRNVVFQRSNQLVYLVMTLDSARFQGDLREYWLRAVNGFQWD